MQQGSETKKPSSGWRNVAIVLLVVVGAALFLCVVLPFIDKSGTIWPAPPTSSNPGQSATFGHEVIYRVSGSAHTASLTYEAPGGTQQEDVTLPWHSAPMQFDSGASTYISAQIKDDQSGSITVEIIYNGSVAKTATSNGLYVIATSSGRVP